jgi:hypothetical protein
MPTISSRDFNRGIAGAKRAAGKEPVIITDRGKPTFVLMRHETYRKLIGRESNIADPLAHPASEEIDFDPPKLGNELARLAEFG